jgi:uncharacterized protein YjiS (DUF1127 family)
MDGNVSLHEFSAAPPAPCPRARRLPVLQFITDQVMGALERARGRRTLRLLDDRMLRDIGIDRGTAAYEGDKPFWR